ncbi:hypothetical protein [uncultured Arsenicicoccus sp.]|uniref:hypothetical protein n=1 Tax=uncultured Arsenicicoccus sp. TaxID=491339 RepID=UPI00259A6904|nr:hypothetical protein [uncultured Arsenicicoccus sp.]
MITQRRVLAAALGASTVLAGLAAATPASADQDGPARSVLVLARSGAADGAVRDAITRAGGSVTAVDSAIGLYTVTTTTSRFTGDVRGADAVETAAADRVVGFSRKPAKASASDIERLKAERAQARGKKAPAPSVDTNGEPLAPLQWDMRMIRTAEAHRIATGRGVRVVVIDTPRSRSSPRTWRRPASAAVHATTASSATSRPHWARGSTCLLRSG